MTILISINLQYVKNHCMLNQITLQKWIGDNVFYASIVFIQNVFFVVVFFVTTECSMDFPKLPPHSGSVLSVVDMHTGGEPLRIILSGYPEVKGDTILAKRRYVREHLDHLRKVLMFEPRGHYDMYGALLVRSELAEADLGVLFMHNEGYSTMCGHAVIALGRFAVDYGLIKEPTSPETQINIHCPCGLVKAFTEYSNGKTGAVRFHSVPAFAFATGEQYGVIIKHLQVWLCSDGVTLKHRFLNSF